MSVHGESFGASPQDKSVQDESEGLLDNKGCLQCCKRTDTYREDADQLEKLPDQNLCLSGPLTRQELSARSGDLADTQ